MHRASYVSAILGAVILAAPPSQASGQTSEDFRSEARMRAGALYFTPTFTLDNFGVDTNVFNSSEEPKKDFVVTVSPRVDAWLPAQRRALLTMSFVAGIDFYSRFDSERSFNPDARARIDVPVSRLNFFAGVQYLNTRQRPSFEIDVRSQRVEAELDGGVEVSLFRKLSLGVRALKHRLRYDADASFEGTDLAETLNREETAAIVTARWRRSVLTTITLATEVRTARFVFSPERDSDDVMFRVGGQFHPRALISGSGYVGVRRFDALSSALPDFAGIVALADLSYRMLATTTVIFTAERDVRYSFEPTEPYYVLNRYGVDVGRQLTGPFDVTVGFGRDSYEYRELELAPAPEGGEGTLAGGAR